MTAHSILGNTRRADISFWTSGKIDIASRVVRALRMEPGDVIDICLSPHVPHSSADAMRPSASPPNTEADISAPTAADYAP